DFITIMGPSGSGKSTLLKLIGLQIDFTSGSIQFKGKNIADYNPMEYRKDVSYFFQNAVLFGKTVRDNLAFPSNIRDEPFDKEAAIQSLKEVQLPSNYLNKEIQDLSGGEKQRVALIRNMVYPPEILLMDEVTSSLDQKNRENILNYVKKRNKNDQTTILWVTHNQEEIDASNRLIKIVDGKLEEE
ncbi:MAG: ATP-binding cassette domain-containing protein, partial [Atopostipes sp.]|nr:ATP-binding cassette domain-containing protein [Atopostipes sp.]